MFRRLVLQNFQPHKKQVFDFDEYCTVIVGPSDSGKSSIIRGLAYACFNNLSGSGFVTHGEEEAKVTLYIDKPNAPEGEDDFWKVSRIRSENKNVYMLDSQAYKAFGTNVPDDIKNLLNLDESINIQAQLDGPFWFDQTPGQISKNLNQIVALGDIDEALSKAASLLTSARQRNKVIQERIVQAEAKVTSSQWIVDVEADVQNVVRLADLEKALSSKVADLSTRIEQYESYTARYKEAGKVIITLSRARNIAEDILEREKKITAVSYLIGKVKELQSKSHTPDLNFQNVVNIRGRMDFLYEEITRLEEFVDKAVHFEESKCRAETEIKLIEETIHQTCKGVCPLCGSKTDSQMLTRY